VRIIGGEKKGRKLVRWRGLPVRPLRDRVRTALFDVLKDFVPDSDVLDLFAGTGAVGLEALSRGARRATFVERSPRVGQLIRHNVCQLGYLQQTRIIIGDAVQQVRELAKAEERFDLVYVGAPYGTGLGQGALLALAEHSPLSPGAVVVVEMQEREFLEDQHAPLQREQSRTYGETRLDFFRFVPDGPPD